ncbi:MAG: glycosyltransferase [bacterium]
MQISVIIPTYKRQKYLAQLLGDLSRQTFKDFEVVVVDQGNSTPALPAGRRRGVEWINLDKPSIVKAKNLGISRAKGGIILVLDDDLRLPKDLVEKHVGAHKKRGVVAVAGPALEKDVFIIKRGGKTFGEFSLLGELNTDYRRVENPTLVTAVPGGNLSFKKSHWRAIGGYDEKFAGNCINEDSDFCLRLTRQFGKILFDPALAVTHLRAEGGSRAFGSAQSAKWYEDMFYNHLHFYLKHWPKTLLPLFFMYRMRQVYTCVARYGKFKLNYARAPLKGYQRALKL